MRIIYLYENWVRFKYGHTNISLNMYLFNYIIKLDDIYIISGRPYFLNH